MKLALLLLAFCAQGELADALEKGGFKFTGRTFIETEGQPIKMKIQYGNQPQGEPYVGKFSGVVAGDRAHLSIDNRDAKADIYREGSRTVKREKRTRGAIELDTFAKRALALCDFARLRKLLSRGTFKAEGRLGEKPMVEVTGELPADAFRDLRPRGRGLGVPTLEKIEVRARIDEGGNLLWLRLALQQKVDYGNMFRGMGGGDKPRRKWINFEFTITGRADEVEFPPDLDE